MNEHLPHINTEELKNILIKRCDQKKRVILAIAGPPASGKSTLAENISQHFNSKQKDFSSILPLDGFHMMILILFQQVCEIEKVQFKLLISVVFIIL